MTEPSPPLLRWIGFAVAVAVVVATTAVLLSADHAPPVVHMGEAQVGGPFSLTSHDARTVTDGDLRGRPFVVYFGWTRDPDLTPAALQVLSEALRLLGGGPNVPRPIFITLDPERESQADLANFVARFGDGIVGLRGSPEATASIVRDYKLYVARIPAQALPGGYSIDHASLYYVMGSDGRFRGLIAHTTDVSDLAAEIRRLAE